MYVKINQKNYKVPMLGFKEMVYIEDMGFSLPDMFRNDKFFSLATAFVGICANCSRKDAEFLCEQHVLGGGDLGDIYTKFHEAMEESDFFKKLILNIRDEQENQTDMEEAATEQEAQADAKVIEMNPDSPF